MVTDIIQEGRELTLETPLGQDVLVPVGFSGEERVSGLFAFHIDMVSNRETIEASEILGKSVTLKLKRPGMGERMFNGLVRSFSPGASWIRGYRAYSAVIVPWTWFLTRTSDCRIFQEKTVPEIIEEVFSDNGFSDYTMRASGSHPARVYCVQYRESDFNFISRLMEEEGMFYYFEHSDGRHNMLIADNTGAYGDCEQADVEFRAAEDVVDAVNEWRLNYEFRSGTWAQRDFNFETPSNDLETSESTMLGIPDASNYEQYDYPGRYDNTGDGREMTRLRMEEEETPHEEVEGAGAVKSFVPGVKFRVSKHEARDQENRRFVLTRVRHEATTTDLYSGGDQVGYTNDFSCIPDSVVFRPQRSTPKGRVDGPQTAFVVGPGGEEIYTDSHGRVKVQFHWDRYGQKNERSSCWLRVAQPWTGKNWGMQSIPRIGMEVVVDFLEGDPDRPMVTGMVYNAEQMPPYALPGNKTQTGVKTRSSMNGGDANFNEIRFEDLKGSEELYIHAEKDMLTNVENDQTLWVGRDQTITIDRDRTDHVKRDVTTNIDRHETREIGQNRTLTVGMNQTTDIGMDHEVSVGMNQKETVSMGSEHKAGTTVKIEAGISMELKANASLKLTCGGASIQMTPASITISAPSVTVSGSAMLTLSGGMVNFSGGLVKIN